MMTATQRMEVTSEIVEGLMQWQETERKKEREGERRKECDIVSERGEMP